MAMDFPNSPTEGQVFSVGPMTWVYTSGVWQSFPGGGRAIVSDTAPANPVVGDLWFESDTGSLYVFYDGFWIEVGYPATPVAAGGRNRIINGDFQVWRKGAGPYTTDGVITADKWKTALLTTVLSVTRQAFTPGNAIVGYEPTYFIRGVTTAGATASELAVLMHSIESGRTFAGQTVTVSFWAKADAARNVSIEFAQNYGAGGSPSAQITSIGATKIPITTVWTRYSVSVAIPSVLGKTFGTTHDGYLRLHIWLSGGSDYNARTASLGNQSGTFDIWGVQVEPGAVATPFEVRPFGDVEAACQRYGRRLTGSSWTPFGTGFMNASNTASKIYCPLGVPLRAVPTAYTAQGVWVVQFSHSTSEFAVNTATISSGESRPDVIMFNITHADQGANRTPCVMRAPADATAWIDFDVDF